MRNLPDTNRINFLILTWTKCNFEKMKIRLIYLPHLMKYFIRQTGLCLIILACILHSCKKREVPVLTTSAVTGITGTTAVCGGIVTTEGSDEITARGVCWSTSNTPTITDYKTNDGSGVEDFTSQLSDLDITTTYYVRAYATNKAGTGYGEVKSFTTLLADYDGNIYTTVTIGMQVWMVENLETTRYNDGNAIPLVQILTEWSSMTTPAYCWYQDNGSAYTAYGAVYNWYAVNSGKLCPTGWHVPSYSEWTVLTTYLTDKGYGFGGSGSDIAKSVAATTGWLSSSETGTVGNDQASNNKSGFTAVPGGMFIEGKYYVLGETGSWWSSTKVDDAAASWSKQLNYSNSGFEDLAAYYNYCGLSVRCLKD